ncbi:MAG: flagellar biosynthesis protein FlhF [Rhodocyclaceae bacterium]|nr:flagellar biosynthesis protein FlhF [Rhodocyclaceae bacterium]
MTVKRYVAGSAREALRRIKEDLGADAIVISNKMVPNGVEITAMSADSLEALSNRPAPVAQVPRPVSMAAADITPAAPATTFSEDDYTVSLSTKARAPQTPFRPWIPPVADKPPVAPPALFTQPRPLPPRVTKAPRPTENPMMAAYPENDEVPESRVNHLMSEMQGIKALLERQLAGFAWGEMTRQTPIKATLLSEMLDAGFSSALSRRLIEEMPDALSVTEGQAWLKNAVGRRLRTLTADNDLMDKGGVFALVGPTGVGKTTTTAKLAARCVVRYGADKLALLTTDGYRIGAHEQLRIYGRILGVPVQVVRDSEDLRRMLVDLRGKHMILIDTVGMSQRDRMVAEQTAMLARAGEVKRLLLLNATSRGDTLDDVIRAYAGENLAGCILSKVDEAASLAPAIDAVVRNGLLLTHVANGQRVPEDLHVPNRQYLLHRAFKQSDESSPHHLHEEEAGLLVANA